MTDRPQWLIKVPHDLEYFPVAAAFLFDSSRLDKFAQTVKQHYRLDQGLTVPADIADFQIYFDSHNHEKDLPNTMIRLGFAAQVINYLISHGRERYIREPEHAGHGYAVTVINSRQLCSDIDVELHGAACLVDTENRAKYSRRPLLRVNVVQKGFLARYGDIFKFDADKKGPGKEGIFLRY